MAIETLKHKSPGISFHKLCPPWGRQIFSYWRAISYVSISYAIWAENWGRTSSFTTKEAEQQTQTAEGMQFSHCWYGGVLAQEQGWGTVSILFR